MGFVGHHMQVGKMKVLVSVPGSPSSCPCWLSLSIFPLGETVGTEGGGSGLPPFLPSEMQTPAEVREGWVP